MKIMPLIGILFSAIASIILIIPLLKVKRKISDDFIVSMDKETGDSIQRKHLKGRNIHLFALIFIVLSLIISVYPYISNNLVKKPDVEVSNTIPETKQEKSEKEIMSDSLNTIVQSMIEGIEAKNWRVLYDSRSEEYRNNVTPEQFDLRYKYDTFYSIKPSNPTITINDNIGTIYFEITACKDATCSESSTTNYHVAREYIYENGEWSVYERKPTQEALDCSASLYTIYGESEFLSYFGGGSKSVSFALKECANILDMLPERLALCKAQVEKYKADSSRPIINYESPDIKYEAPSYSDTNVRCTTRTVGNYSYTNCY